MLKENYKLLQGVYILMDVCIIIIAYFLSYYLRFQSVITKLSFFRIGTNEKYYPLISYIRQLVVVIPLYLVINYLFRLYKSKSETRAWLEVIQSLFTNLVGVAFLLMFLYFTKVFDISRIFLMLFFVINTILSFLAHMMMKSTLGCRP